MRAGGGGLAGGAGREERTVTLRHRFGLLLVWLLPALAVGWTMYRAPAWQEPRALTVTLEPGRSLVLGREALRAPQADGEHVLLRREVDGGWWLANLAPGKQVLWRPVRGDGDRPTREWPLAAGAAFAVGDQSRRIGRIFVGAVEPDRRRGIGDRPF